MNLIEQIRKCEDAYIRCFSLGTEDADSIRFVNAEMPDMYDHNFLYIKPGTAPETRNAIMKDELEMRRKQGRDFCKIVMDELPDMQQAEEFFGPCELAHYGEYMYVPKARPEWPERSDCRILNTKNKAMTDDLVKLDVLFDGKTLGEDFCRRKGRYHGKVCLSEPALGVYICYLNGEPVGRCDLFISGGTAKAEDFIVLPEYQRKGIGTTLLKFIVTEAFKEGADCIYLVTDEDDTAKEMYGKLGFQKMKDTYALLRRNMQTHQPAPLKADE